VTSAGPALGIETAGFPGCVADAPIVGVKAVMWIDGAAPARGNVFEMSPRDIKLCLAPRLELGGLVELELLSDVHGFTVCARGIVHWRQPHPVGWQVGVFLRQPLPNEVVTPCWSELRKELRYPCQWPCRLVSPRRRPHDGVILNYSRSGLLVEAHAPVAGGDELSLLDPFAGQPLLVGVVRWRSQPEPGRYLIGCELPDEDGVRLAAYLRAAGAMG
jgi:hypothetical protein